MASNLASLDRTITRRLAHKFLLTLGLGVRRLSLFL